MPPEKLVLLKTRRQRLAEAIVLPLIWLPIGPALRALFGNQYSFLWGIGIVMALILVTTDLARRWAVRHGAEWVTPAERLRRMASEASTPRWQNAVTMMAMVALSITGMLLVIEPIDQIGSLLSGAPDSWAFVALISVLAGAQTLFMQRRTKRVVVADETVAVDEYWSLLRRMVPRAFLAYGIGGLVGFAIALQLDGSWRFSAFAIGFLTLSFFLMQRLSPGPLQVRALAAHPRLSMAMVTGVLLWGTPMAILFSGMALLEPRGTSLFRLIFVSIMIVVGGLGGLAFGALLHLIRRLSEPEQDVRGGQ